MCILKLCDNNQRLHCTFCTTAAPELPLAGYGPPDDGYPPPPPEIIASILTHFLYGPIQISKRHFMYIESLFKKNRKKCT